MTSPKDTTIQVKEDSATSSASLRGDGATGDRREEVVDLSKATPRPWVVNPHARTEVFCGLDINCGVSGNLAYEEHREYEAAANAALIVTAVNSYDDMLAALKANTRNLWELESITRRQGDSNFANIIRACAEGNERVITKAEGKS